MAKIGKIVRNQAIGTVVDLIITECYRKFKKYLKHKRRVDRAKDQGNKTKRSSAKARSMGKTHTKPTVQ
jgi:hypothetical protein